MNRRVTSLEGRMDRLDSKLTWLIVLTIVGIILKLLIK